MIRSTSHRPARCASAAIFAPGRRFVVWIGAAIVLALGASLALVGCHAARIVAPPPPLRATSSSPYGLDLEFAEPLDRASAEALLHYTIVPAGGGAPVSATLATLVDTYYGRVVELIVPDWSINDPDGLEFDVTASGVLTLDHHSTGTRTVRFHAGLGYAAPVRALLDAHCSSCHGATQAQGNYRTDSYAALFGNGTDATPNVIAGDPVASRLVIRCKPGNKMFDFGGLTYLDYAILSNWVESYAARP